MIILFSFDGTLRVVCTCIVLFTDCFPAGGADCRRSGSANVISSPDQTREGGA